MSRKDKLLGVTFSSKSPAGELKDSWENILVNIQITLNVWFKRDLSLIGKNLILKPFALSKLNHLIESIGLPNTVVKHLSTLFFRFLLEKNGVITKELLKRLKGKLCITQQKKAVLKILNSEAIQSAAYLHWAEKKTINRSRARLESISHGSEQKRRLPRCVCQHSQIHKGN